MKTGNTRNGEPGLVSSPAADRPLSQRQEAFRNLLARIESLRESIDAEQERLDEALNFYAVEVVPRLAAQTTQIKELVRLLAPFLNKTFFPRRLERLEFKEMIQEFLSEIALAEKGLTDEDLRQIYSTVNSVSYLEQEQKTLASVKEALEKMFAEEGLEADLSELESASSEADFMVKAEELTARMRRMKEAEKEAAHCGDTGHFSTDDEQLRIEEKFRKQNIAKIYKELARVLHPDLEQDRELQKQKGELMQELTVAFRQNDLHTLLRLEMQWIEKEGGNIERLTEEKLGVYNEVLGGQVEGLEQRLRNLIFHPRYRPIFVWENRIAQTIDGPTRARELDERIAKIEHAVCLMKNAGTADDVRTAIGPLRPAELYPLD